MLCTEEEAEFAYFSSNRGEKANNLAVVDRQKHNGMSWSKTKKSGVI
ncbi:MAG: hypothetical protein PWR10_1736 [Halanaerobiales bacterium]|nr:hypothetical protein [Halanaerobiales bacterium]